MQIAMEVNIETVLDEDDREVEERERFYRDAADDITAALESELYQFDVVHENYTLTLDLGTPWVVKEQGACEGCDSPTAKNIISDLLKWEAQQGGYEAPVWDRARGLLRDCEGCPEPTGEVASYVVDFEQGGLTVVRYCEGCADLARTNWNGEVRRFVGSIGGRVEKEPVDPVVQNLRLARGAVADAVSTNEAALRSLHSFMRDDEELPWHEDLGEILEALQGWRDASQAAVDSVTGRKSLEHPAPPKSPFRVGDRVRLLRPVERYPHFIAPEGATGVVAHVETYAIHVRLDEPLAGAETWDNEVHWYKADDSIDAIHEDIAKVEDDA